MIILTPAAAATAARRYTNPITGNHAMATMGTFVQLLPKGFATAAYRSTDATVFVPIEGVAAHGSGTISSSNGASGTSSSSRPGIMSGTKVTRTVSLFSFSDRPIQQALYLFREDRCNP